MNFAAQIEAAKNELSHYRNSPFRQYQKEAIAYILQSEKKFIFLEAPCGAGKSLIGIISALCKNSANYSVHSKTLQHQITQDFPEAKSLFGRSNYTCARNPALTCAECSHTGNSFCKYKKEDCLYEIQKAKVLASRLRILNYDYLLNACNYTGNFSVLKDPAKNFNVLDEADSIENTLINFVTMTFTSYGLNRLGLKNEIEELKHTSKDKEKLLSSWKFFAELAMAHAQEIKKDLNIRIANFCSVLTPDNIRTLKDQVGIVRMMEKIKLFIENVDETWLYDDSQENRYIFRPLWLNEEIANQFMWRHSEKWLLMSASFLPVHIECKRLGIPLDETDYKVIPSTFPVSRRPIHIEEVANLTGKTMSEETPKLIVRIDEIIKNNPDVKGLIHAVSFKLANEIYRGIDSDRLVIHNSANRQDKLEFFMESKDPLVLISPSMERGVSLSMDLCRFIIIAKCPFLSLAEKIIAARLYSSGKIGHMWYIATAMTTVLQMCGRGIRSKDDSCETWILDAQFKRIYQQYPSFLPPWWKDSVEW
jgi:Rad3-related DNA helicase